MDTTTERGFFSGENSDNVYRVNVDQLEDIEPLIRAMLERQPLSYEPLMSVDDVVANIATSLWTAYIFTTENEDIYGMALVSIRQTGKGIFTMCVEMMTCAFFFRMAQMYEYLETIARNLGCSYVDAIAHPNIAEYAVKKQGFVAPSVYIRKCINYGRNN